MSTISGENIWGYAVSSNGVGAFKPENLDNKKIVIKFADRKVYCSAYEIESVEILSCTSEWVKYMLTLKNGEKFALYISSLEDDKNGKKINCQMLNLEWWLFDFIYKNCASVKTSGTSINSSVNKGNIKQNIIVKNQTLSKPGKWTCSHCGYKNSDGKIYCSSCGEYK